jgi:hypothetical protein
VPLLLLPQALEARLQARASVHVNPVTPFFQEQQLLTDEDLQLSPGRLNSRPPPGAAGNSSAAACSADISSRADSPNPEQCSCRKEATEDAADGATTSQQQQQQQQAGMEKEQKQPEVVAEPSVSQDASYPCSHARPQHEVTAAAGAAAPTQEPDPGPICSSSGGQHSSRVVTGTAGAGEGGVSRVRWDTTTAGAPEQQQQQQQQEAVDVRVRSPSPCMLLQPSSHSVYGEVSWSDPGSHYSFHGQLQEASSCWAAGSPDQEGSLLAATEESSMLADGYMAHGDNTGGFISAAGSFLGSAGQGAGRSIASAQAGRSDKRASPGTTAAAAAAGRQRTTANPASSSTATRGARPAGAGATAGRSWAVSTVTGKPAPAPVMAAYSGMLFRPAASNLPAPHYVPPMTLSSILATGSTAAAAAGEASGHDYGNASSRSSTLAASRAAAGAAADCQESLTAELQQLEEEEQQQQEGDGACGADGLLAGCGLAGSGPDRASSSRASDSSSIQVQQQQRTVRPLMETYMAQRNTLTATSYAKQGTLLAKGLTAVAAAAAPGVQEGIADAVPTCRSPVSPDRTLMPAAAAAVAARGSPGRSQALHATAAAGADVQRPLDALQHAEKLLQRRADPSSPSKQRQQQQHRQVVSSTTAGGPKARARQWAEDDAAADAEANAWLADHRRQQQLPNAALLLQTAWRARAPRLFFNR